MGGGMTLAGAGIANRAIKAAEYDEAINKAVEKA
jgi:hypothetical protein